MKKTLLRILAVILGIALLCAAAFAGALFARAGQNGAGQSAGDGTYSEYMDAADVWIRMPNLRQYGFSTCGTTCVQMIANWMFPGEGDINLVYLEEELGTTSEGGTTPDSILAWFRENGISAQLRTGMSVPELADAVAGGNPVLIALQAWSTADDGSYNTDDPSDAETYLIEGHYVICVGYQKTENGWRFYFNDPACVGYCYMEDDELDTRWIDVDANGTVYDHAGIVIDGSSRYDPLGAFHLD